MRRALPKSFVRRILRAIIEFDLLQEGDRVLMGLSGGKDSQLMVYALSTVVKHLPFEVELGALTIDLGFPEAPVNEVVLKEFCDQFQIPHYTLHTELSQVIFNHPRQGPCAQCAYFRRGVFNKFAKEQGYNKIALGHHHDDAVVTFFMGLLYNGKMQTFLPLTELDQSGMTIIRPLVYLREKEIIRLGRELGLEPIKSPCPVDKTTKRQETKELIENLSKTVPDLYNNLACAMHADKAGDLWPRELTKAEIWEKSKSFWKR